MFLTGLDRVLNDSGVKWTARPGWRTRTAHRGGLVSVRAVMWHSTESSNATFASGRTAPTLEYVQSGLGYPLYQLLIGRDGRVYLICAGTAAHAGTGSGLGMPVNNANRYSFAISADSNNSGYPITLAQLEAGARLGAAIDREWNNSIRHVAHGQWAPRRRSDVTKVPGGWSALWAAINRGSWTNSPPQQIPEKGRPLVTTPEDVWRYRGTDYVNDNNSTQQAKLARAHQYAFEQPGRVWGHRNHDFVNDSPNSYGFMLARIHQYVWEERARMSNIESDLAGLRTAIEAMAAAEGDHVYDAVTKALKDHDERTVRVEVTVNDPQEDESA